MGGSTGDQDTERLSVECFRLGPDGHWVLYPLGPGQDVGQASLGFRCSPEQVYEDVELGESSAARQA